MATKNKTWWIPGAFIVGSIIYLIRNAKHTSYYQGLRVLIGNVKFSGKQLSIEMKIENPNQSPLLVSSIVGDVYVNNNPVGRVNMFTQYVISPNNQTIVPLKIEMRVVNVIAELASILQGKRSGTMINFNGTININKNPLPLNINYRLA